MMKFINKLAVTVAVSFAIASIAGAHQVDSKSEKRSHGKHVHGLGELNLVVEGSTVVMDWTNPAMNITGFGVAHSQEQRDAVREATAQMENATELFVFSKAANCKLVSADVEYTVLNSDDDHHDAHESDMMHDSHGHHDGHQQGHGHGHTDEYENHGHDDHHEDGHHNGHGHGHGHEGGGHADFKADYVFNCDNPDKLEALDVTIFDTFPLIKTTNLQLLTPNKQTVIELNKNSTRVDL